MANKRQNTKALRKEAVDKIGKSKVVQDILNNPNLPERVKQNMIDAVETPPEPIVENPVDVLIAEPIETIKNEKPIVQEEIVENPPVVEEPELALAQKVEEDLALNDDKDYKQMYSSLKGKYDVEVPRLIQVAKSKDDVITFYKDENITLRNQLETAIPDVPVSELSLSDTAKQKLEDAGFDGDDLTLAQDILSEQTKVLRAQLVQAQKKSVGNSLQSYDSLLISEGFVDSQAMKKQPQYEYAMKTYGNYGQTAQQLLDSAVKNGDMEGAAAVLVDVQAQMVQEGRWEGIHPQENPEPIPEPVKIPAPVATLPKSVLPHSITTTVPVEKQPLPISAIEQASLDLSKGKITYEKFREVSKQIMSQLQAGIIT